MTNIGRINLNRLTHAEIGEMLSGKGDSVHVGFLDWVMDFFRSETKRETIDTLLSKMRDPSDPSDPRPAVAYLQNFETIISYAKPEALRQFGLEVQRRQEDGLTADRLKFSIGGVEIASHEVAFGKHFGSLHAYAALYRLRGELADVTAGHRLASFGSVEEVTALIQQSIDDLTGTRRRYGEISRTLANKIVAELGAAPRAGDAVPREASGSLMSSATIIATLDILHEIDKPLVDACGPRLIVRHLDDTTLARDKLNVRQLFDQDADFAGVNVNHLLKNQANFLDLSVAQLIEQAADVHDTNLSELRRLGASVGNISLGELLDLGVRGGGYPLFNQPGDPQGPASSGLNLHGGPGTPKVQLSAALDAEFAVSEVPVNRLAAQFDLHDCSMERLLSHEVNVWNARIDELRDQGLSFRDSQASELAAKGMSFARLTIEELTAMDIAVKGVSAGVLLRQHLPVKGVQIASWLHNGVDIHGLEFKAFDAEGGSCRDVDFQTLHREGMLFTGVAFHELVALDELEVPRVSVGGAALQEVLGLVSVEGVNAGELIGAQVQADETSLATLLGKGVKFDEVKITGLQAWAPNLNLYGTFMRTLLDQGADFALAPVKWLKERGASFASVTYGDLHSLKCDFTGLTLKDLEELGRAFLQKTSLNDLLGKVDLSGAQLTQLMTFGVKLERVSVTALLAGHIRLKGFTVDDLAAKGAIVFDTPILALQAAGLQLAGEKFKELRGYGIVFADSSFERLHPQIRFDGSFGTDLIDAGVRLESKQDISDFVARGGTVMRRPAPPARGGAGL